MVVSPGIPFFRCSRRWVAIGVSCARVTVLTEELKTIVLFMNLLDFDRAKGEDLSRVV